MADPSVQPRPSFPCPSCPLVCKSGRGLAQHQQTIHRQFTPDDDADGESFTTKFHPFLNATPCDRNGNYLPPFSPPPLPEDNPAPNSWRPFKSRAEFDFSYYHFVEAQSSASNIDKVLDIWAAIVMEYGGEAPWTNTATFYQTIDAIQHGDSPWKTYYIQYQGPRPPGTPPKWMTEKYVLCARDSRQVLQHQLSTTQFKGKVNLVPYRQFDGKKQRVWSNLMSADWAWSQADTIAEKVDNHGAMFVPVIAGSDKTTVSVATGHQEYHPVYMSMGNLTNVVRRSHGNSVLPVAFLPIPKTSKNQRKTVNYQTFCRQMYHACLACVFNPLMDGMTTPEVVRCPDGHFRRAVYGLGPYIADYPEQVWLSGIVQGWCPKCNARPENLDGSGTHRRTKAITDYIIGTWNPNIVWTDFGLRADILPFTHKFPRADIHELLTPDLLHQVIKGTFKDHLVTWVTEYLYEEHGETGANAILGDIDRRISAVPAFPGLRRFPDGRDFAQWTGDDSKALMKVYLSAIVGYVPSAMVKTLSAFLDFCYIARRNALTVDALEELKTALDLFHFHRDVFVGTAAVNGERISLPRQHSIMHYYRSIQLFGSPNGLCSSITESKHIKAVKEPWRRSSHYKALKQMLVTISRLEKLASASRVFSRVGMMEGTTSSYTAMILRGELPQPRATDEGDNEDDDAGPVHGPRTLSSIELARTAERGYPRAVEDLAAYINQPQFPQLLRHFLYEQLNPDLDVQDVDVNDCPYFGGPVSVHHSATARFYAPSDLCGVGGMYRERIRSNPNWRGEYARRDTMFVETNARLDGMPGMTIARALLFFSFTFDNRYYPCALVNWLVPGDEPDEDTGLWVVQPEFEGNGRHRTLSIIHLDCVARAAHLLPVYGSSPIPEDFHFSDALDAFRAYFVNRFVDHHSHDFI